MGTYVIFVMLLLLVDVSMSIKFSLRDLINKGKDESINEFERHFIKKETPNGMEFSCEEMKMSEVSSDDIIQDENGEDKSKVIETLACDGKEISIDCKDEIIKIIYANYGRKSKDVCSEPGSLKFTSCSAKDSIILVKQTCHNKNSCKLKADVSVFGNPCRRVQKYLEVKYTCEHATSQVACDGRVMKISCPENRYINVVYANYGRTDKTTCGGFVSFTFVLCSAKDSIEKVQNRCEGKQACSIVAGFAEFGDPCRMISKYLEVKYTCEKAFDGEEIEISPGPPKIISISQTSAVISVDPEIQMASSNLYKLEIKFSSKNTWFEVVNNQGFDFKKTQILDKLWQGQEYDIRVFLKKVSMNTCIPFTRFKTND